MLRVELPGLLIEMLPIELLEVLPDKLSVDPLETKLERSDRGLDDRVVGRPALLRLTIGGMEVSSGGCEVINDGCAVTNEGSVAAASDVEIASADREPTMVEASDGIPAPTTLGKGKSEELAKITAVGVDVDESDDGADATSDAAAELFEATTDAIAACKFVVRGDASDRPCPFESEAPAVKGPDVTCAEEIKERGVDELAPLETRVCQSR